MVHKNDAPIAIIAVKNVWRLQRLADRARFFQQGVDWVIPLFLVWHVERLAQFILHLLLKVILFQSLSLSFIHRGEHIPWRELARRMLRRDLILSVVYLQVSSRFIDVCIGLFEGLKLFFTQFPSNYNLTVHLLAHFDNFPVITVLWDRSMIKFFIVLWQVARLAHDSRHMRPHHQHPEKSKKCCIEYLINCCCLI